jgi:hypothetical protein
MNSMILGVGILSALLLAGSVFITHPFSGAPTVVISSDNAADSAIARAVAEASEGELVEVPWGNFKEESLKRVLSLKPGRVIIVGSEEAVPREYERILKDKNIEVVRLGGNDSFETSDVALKWLLKRGYKPEGNVYILNGWDEGEILYVGRKDPKGLVLIVNPMNHKDLVNAIHERAGLSSKMASASPNEYGYGRSVYVDPTLFDGGNPPCNCTVLRVDKEKVLSLSLGRLRTLAGEVSDDSIRKELLKRFELAESLIGKDPGKAREIVLEGFVIAYNSAKGEKPSPASSSSGSVD